MMMRRNTDAPRRRNERGTALVELALVVPVLVILIMGIVDYSTLSNEKISLRGGVREASWNASRAIFGAPATCPLHLTAQAPTENTKQIMCMVKLRSGLDASDLRVKVRLIDLTNPSASGPYAAGTGLMVCAMRTPESTTHFFTGMLAGHTQKTRLTNIILTVGVAPDAGDVVEAEEDHLPGATWDFCDPNQPVPA